MHNDYYVYLHRRNDSNEVFYVGKGRRYRSTVYCNRNKWWLAIANKHGFTVEYVEKGLSESDAYDLEVETIKFYRECGHTLCNLSDGGEGGNGSVRKQPITDGLLIDLSIPIHDRVKCCTRHWKVATRMPLQVILSNLMLGERIYYNRGKTKAVKCKTNRRGISSHRLVKAIEKLEGLGLLVSTITTVNDSVKRLSSFVATQLFVDKYVQHPIDNRLLDVGYTFDMP